MKNPKGTSGQPSLPPDLSSCFEDQDFLRLLKEQLLKPPDPWQGFRHVGLSLDDSFEPDYGEFFGFNHESLETKAGFAELSGQSPYAEEMRKQAKRLREIEKAPDEARERLMIPFYQAEFEVFPEVFFLCQFDAEMRATLASKTLKYCQHLILLAQDGKMDAIRDLAEIAILATQALNSLNLPESKREALRQVAAGKLSWPVMTSPAPHLESPDVNATDLGIGSSFPINLSKGRRFRIDTPSGKIAWKLWLYVFHLKNDAQAFIDEKNIQLKDLPGPMVGKERLRVAHEAVLLPKFTSDSADVEKWWDVAQRCLIAAFPNPTDEKILNENAPLLDTLVTATSHRKTAGKKRSRIINKLRESFYSIAGVHDPKKKKA